MLNHSVPGDLVADRPKLKSPINVGLVGKTTKDTETKLGERITETARPLSFASLRSLSGYIAIPSDCWTFSLRASFPRQSFLWPGLAHQGQNTASKIPPSLIWSCVNLRQSLPVRSWGQLPSILHRGGCFGGQIGWCFVHC